jgi:hypothetical protein
MHFLYNKQKSLDQNVGALTGGVAQVLECLLCKCEALSSNLSPIKKNIVATFINVSIL